MKCPMRLEDRRIESARKIVDDLVEKDVRREDAHLEPRSLYRATRHTGRARDLCVRIQKRRNRIGRVSSNLWQSDLYARTLRGLAFGPPLTNITFHLPVSF